MTDSDWFVAGSVGGAAGLLVGQPLDTVKVLLQQSDTSAEERPLLGHGRGGAWSLLVERPARTFAGLVPPLLALGFLNAILFWTFATTVRLVAPRQDASVAVSLLAGGLAGLAGCVVSIPTEYLKVRQQVGRHDDDNDIASTQEIRSATGRSVLRRWSRTVARVWRFGGLATVLRDTIGYGVWFFTYDAVLAVVAPARRDEDLYVLLAGGLAGVAGWAIIYPLDTVKTRQQANATNRAPVPMADDDAESIATARTEPSVKARTRRAPVYGSIVRTTLHIVREGGTRALFAGFWACMLRAFVADAVTFWVVKYVEGVLGSE